jgi:hypothetical protein
MAERGNSLYDSMAATYMRASNAGISTRGARARVEDVDHRFAE